MRRLNNGKFVASQTRIESVEMRTEIVCCRQVSGEINLLKYFQQQRLEHTRLLRKEITRLEKLEKVYLSAIKKVCSWLPLSLQIVLELGNVITLD